MHYVRRNPSGAIDSLHRLPEDSATEFLPDEHAEVQSFVGRPPEGDGFSRLDADFVRVIEDVIDTLIVKNVLNITDLPAEAQAKLFARKSFRERATRNSLHLFSASGADEVI